MNPYRPSRQNISCWSTSSLGNNTDSHQNTGLPHNNQFYTVSPPMSAPFPNQIRYSAQQPPFRMQQPMYNNHPPWPTNNVAFIGAPYPSPRLENFSVRMETFTAPAPLYVQPQPSNFGAPFPGHPQQNSRFTFFQGYPARPPLLPTPSPPPQFLNTNPSCHSQNFSFQPMSRNICASTDNNNYHPYNNNNCQTMLNRENNFQSVTPVPMFFGSGDNINMKEEIPPPTGDRVIFKRREDKYRKRLSNYPDLPIAIHEILHYMDEDTEIIAYFDAEIQMFYRNKLVFQNDVHVIFTKPSELSLTWVLAFIRDALLQPNTDILKYNRAINRFLRLSVVSETSVSLNSEEQHEECVLIHFCSPQESQRFQGSFHKYKSELGVDKRRMYDDSPMHDGNSMDNHKSARVRSGQRDSEPIAWITKMPPEIAEFHGDLENSPVPKKIRQNDDFIYDSTTFHNALNLCVNGKPKNDSSECDLGKQEDAGNLTLETCRSCDESNSSNNDEILFTARNICLLMKTKSIDESNDYRSPGFGTLIIISNPNYYNQLEFIDSNNVLKCRHYIDHGNTIKIAKAPRAPEEECCCTWEAFAEIFNPPKNLRCMMQFKVVLSQYDVACRFEKVMNESIRKCNGQERFGASGSKKGALTF